jgi:hypothetical protein
MTPVNNNTTNKNEFQVILDDLDKSKDILYKFIVDGEWCYDVNKDYIIDDSKYSLCIFSN